MQQFSLSPGTWNLGAGALRNASWVRHFKAGDMEAAETAFKGWNKVGGKTVKGLVIRRALEADLLFRGKWSNDGTIIEYTRLRPDMQVDFASAKRVNVSAELRNAFAGERNPIVDQAPQPDAPVGTPTLSPRPNAAGLIAIIVQPFSASSAGVSLSPDIHPHPNRPSPCEAAFLMEKHHGQAAQPSHHCPSPDDLAQFGALNRGALASSVG